MRTALRLLIPVGALCIGILATTSVAHAEPTVAQLEQQITEKSTELEKVVEQYNQLNEQLKATQAEIAQLQAVIGPLEQRAAQAKGRVADLADNAYKSTGVSGLSILLSGADGRQVLERLGTLQHLANGQQAVITEAHETSAKHTATAKALEQRQADEDSRVKTIENQRKGIEAELDKLNQLKMKARGTTKSGSGAAYTGPIPQIAGAAGVAVTFAYQAIGKPYVFAADGPDSYDCSGLTMAAWAAAGKSLAHYTVTQWEQTARLNRSQLEPGDLVFYSDLGHVAIYIGDNKVIHAPTPGDHVKISSIDMMTPYGYGRVR
jgi:cell wall-associated NlpC family hydrolase